jgi:putative membrane protein
MMYDGHWFGFGGGMWFFWILLLVVAVLVIRAAMGNDSSTISKGRAALDILKERYARGELNQDEFETKRKDLIG